MAAHSNGQSKSGQMDRQNDGTASRGSSWKGIKNWTVLLILLLLAGLGGMYGWKVYAVKNAKDVVKAKANEVLAQQNRASLHLASLALAWAVRSEMIRGNLDQINQYLIAYVHEPNVKEAVLAQPDGTILLATNKRLEGTPVTGAFPPSVLQVESTTVIPLASGMLTASPIMGLNQKLGVLLVLHAPPTYALE